MNFSINVYDGGIQYPEDTSGAILSGGNQWFTYDNLWFRLEGATPFDPNQVVWEIEMVAGTLPTVLGTWFKTPASHTKDWLHFFYLSQNDAYWYPEDEGRIFKINALVGGVSAMRPVIVSMLPGTPYIEFAIEYGEPTPQEKWTGFVYSKEIL